MKNTKRITVQLVSNAPGMEWRSTLHEGSGGKGFYGSTAAEAEAKLRAAYDCEGIEATYIENELVRVASYRQRKEWVWGADCVQYPDGTSALPADAPVTWADGTKARVDDDGIIRFDVEAALTDAALTTIGYTILFTAGACFAAIIIFGGR